MKISLCMIVWNEEKILPRALGNIDDLADEIIIVDTGSTDDTIKVARDLYAKVIVGADRMHKGKARNIAQDHATGDWVVFLDADEWIVDPTELRQYLNTTKARALFVRVGYVDDNGSYTLSWHQMRCWKRGNYQWKYRAHEYPIPVNGWGNEETTEIRFASKAVPGRAWKTQYTLDRLLLDVKENPGDGRPVYYLGRQYKYMGQWEKAIDHLEKYAEMAPNGRDVADAYSHIAHCHGQLGHVKEQKAALYLACSVQPERREFWGTLAELYRAENNQALAAGLLKCALEIPVPNHTYRDATWHGPHIHDTLARCLWSLGRYKEGQQHAQAAVELSPSSQRLRRNLHFFEDKTHSNNLDYLPDVDTRVVFLARADWANVGYRTMQAVNMLDSCYARAVTYHSDYIRYPRDIFSPTNEELDQLLSWANVVHIFDDWPREGLPDKPTFVTYNGSFYRQNWQAQNDSDSIRGITQFCTTLDLEQYGPAWLPVPMGDIGIPVSNNGTFRVVHAPTHRSIKGTQYVEQLRGIDVDIIEGVTNAECLRRKAKGSVLVDQFDLGYGVNALEAWRLGLPVVANANSDILARIRERVGYLPFVTSDPSGLQETINRLRQDSDFYQRAIDIGTDYIDTFHDPVKIAHKLVNLYESAL